MSRVAEQVHDNRALLYGSIHVEEVGAFYPSVLLSLLPARTVFPYANNNVQTIVAKIESLTVTLRAVADQSKRVILEVVEEFLGWPVCALWFGLVNDYARVDSCFEAHRIPPPYRQQSPQSSCLASAERKQTWQPSGS